MKKILNKLQKNMDLSHKKVRVAITGLSRSGKTIFITSLINQLLNNNNLKTKLNKQFKISIIQNDNLEQFKYDEFLSKLSQKEPIWPTSTSDISSITLRLEFAHKILKVKTVDIEIIDYPGEWIVDIELLNKSYEDWSEQSFKLFESEPRKILAKEWLECLNKIDLKSQVDKKIEKELVEKYTNFLYKCNNSKLSLIQPGRFIMPANLKDNEILYFTPLPKTMALAQDSYYLTFKARYERYVEEFVKEFHLNHFSKFDRQVVLVDVLKALKNGYYPFEDMVKTLKIIMSIYSYEKLNFFTRLFKTKIDKVIFCATKADHVANNQHNNYKSLLEMIIKEAKGEIDIQGVQTISTIISSIKSTENLVKIHDNRRLSCLKGKIVGDDKEVIIYPGEVPEYFPTKDDWDTDYFDFPDFAPIPFVQNKAVDNIRMEDIIFELLNDKL